jgi:hypothetical protein
MLAACRLWLEIRIRRAPGSPGRREYLSKRSLEPAVRIELTTYGLQNRCSTIELRRHRDWSPDEGLDQFTWLNPQNGR